MNLLDLPKDIIYRILEYDIAISFIFPDIEWNYTLYTIHYQLINKYDLKFYNVKTLTINKNKDMSLEGIDTNMEKILKRVPNVTKITFIGVPELTNDCNIIKFMNNKNMTLKISNCQNFNDFSNVLVNRLIISYKNLCSISINKAIKNLFASNVIIDNLNDYILEDCSLQDSRIKSIHGLKSIKYIELDNSVIDCLDLRDSDCLQELVLYKSTIRSIRLPKKLNYLMIQDCVFDDLGGLDNLDGLINSIEELENIAIRQQNGLSIISNIKGLKYVYVSSSDIKIIDKNLILKRLECVSCPDLLEIPPLNQIKEYFMSK